MKKNKLFSIIICATIIISIFPFHAEAASEYAWPTEIHNLSRSFSSHGNKAIDIAVPSGTTVYASKSGTVYNTYTGCSNHAGMKGKKCSANGCKPNHGMSTTALTGGYCNYGFGNGVIIRHDDGTFASYAHMSNVYVSVGDWISQGEVLGTSGNSGYCTGSCLHFELRKGNPWKGTIINPEKALSGQITSTANPSASSKPSVTIDGTTVTLSWNTVSGAQYYDAYLVTAPWGWDDIKYSGNTNSTSKTFWNVTPGNYQAFVIARPNADTVKSEWAVVTVSGEQPKPVVDEVTSIKLNRGDFSLTAGESVKLKETIEKTNPATWYFATWESSNPSVASVRQDGTVDAKKAGKTTITVSADGKYAKVNVEVLPTQEDVSVNEPPKREPVRATSIRVYPESVSLSAGETALLTATVYPADAEDKVVWESFDSSIASVNSSGLVTAKSGGMTTVSAMAGGKKVTAMVNVSTPITESMITTTPAPEPKPEPEPPRNNVSFSSIRATDVSQSNAKLNGTCSYSGSTPSEVGVYLGTSSGSMQFVGKDYINHSKNPFDMWYTLNKYGFTLSPGTTYYYKFYAIVDGNEYTSGTSSFTTPSAPANNGTVTGYINGTPGGLAINSQPKSGTKIGRIPEGSYCTVYPSRRSGNWYWVEYNGVSGYAYSQYIVLL